MCSAGSPSRTRSACGPGGCSTARRADFDLIHDNQCLGSGPARDDGRRLAGAGHPAPPDHRRPRPRPRARHERVAAVHAAPLVRVPRHADEGGARDPARRHGVGVEQARHRRSRWACAPTGCTSCPSASTRRSSARCPTVARVPGPAHDDGQRRRADEGPRTAARGAGQGAHRARRRRARDHRQAEGQEQDPRRSSSASASPARCSSCRGVTTERIVELYAEAEVAVRAVALRGLLAARDRGHGLRRAGGGDHRRRAARGRRHRRRDRPARAPRRPRRAGAGARCGRSATPTCGPASAPPAAPGCSTGSPGARTAVGTVENYRALLDDRARRAEPPDADRRLRPARPPRRSPAARHGLRRRTARVRGDAARRDRRRARLRRRPSSRRCAPSSAR